MKPHSRGFLRPIIERLRTQHTDVVLTSRDNAQGAELVQLRGLDTLAVGHEFGKNKAGKVIRTLMRALRLAPRMRRNRPDLAVSHGSRSLTIAAACLGIPSGILFDYELASLCRFHERG